MKKISLHSLRKNEDWIFLAIGTLTALLIRLVLRSYASRDALIFFIPWYESVVQYQGVGVLAYRFTTYQPLYSYLLVLSYYFNQLIQAHPVFAIKFSSIFFDFFAAFWIFKIVRIKFANRAFAMCAALLFLFTPTVFLNSAMWGQVDVIFTAFMLASFYYLLKQRDSPAMIYYALALSFKPQAIFFAPFILVLVLRKQQSILSLLWLPIIFFLTLIPPWIMGRPLGELLTIYFRLAADSSQLTMNAASFYALMDDTVGYLMNPVGILLTGGLVLTSVYAVYKMRVIFTAEIMACLSATWLLLVPYFLPRMHERYFFPAEVFFILAAFFRPKLIWPAIALQITTLSTYSTYFFGKTYLPLATASLINLVVLVYAITDTGSLMLSSPRQEGGSD